ncbi:hypothetical protein GCM10018952_35620 [Streptosporangium vulgare]
MPTHRTAGGVALRARRSTASRRAFRWSPEKRFDQVVVGPRLEQADDLRLVVPRRGHDDRHAGDAADHLERLRPVQVGQPEVEDHRVRGVLGDLPQRVEGAPRAAHGVLAPAEFLDDRGSYVLVVFDHQNRRHAM